MKVNGKILLTTLLSASLVSCNNPNVKTESNEPVSVSETKSYSEDVSEQVSTEEDYSVEELSSVEPEISSDPYDFVDNDFDFSKAGVGEPTVEVMETLPTYNPVTFSKSSYSEQTTSLGYGVDHVVAKYNSTQSGYPNLNHEITVHCVVVDLTKADIVAGSYNNVTDSTFANKSTPLAQAQAWENDNSNGKVIAVTNADFFGSTTVNAFVKDGVILKKAHNADIADVPVSSPMLFGVSKNGAKISTMTNFANYSDNQNAALGTSGVILIGKDGSSKGSYQYNSESLLSKTAIGLLNTTTNKKAFPPESKVYKYKKIQKDKCSGKEVRGCIVEEVTTDPSITSVKNTDVENYGYIQFGGSFTGNQIGVGEYFATLENVVMSPDGIWNYYDTIIGCRHSLLENGLIPSTVAKETSNGASYPVPRTAVGIKDDGKVVIVSVEDLHYGGHNSNCTGLTLYQLADFMRYFGCYDAANFDGGGSSQLLTKDGVNGLGNFVVQTRSSDTASYTPSSSRKVLNTIMVTTKKS